MFEENTDELLQSKLLILYILNRVDIPMLNNDITQFVLEHNYMNYFLIQQFLGELVNSKFIEITTKEGNEYYNLTKAGKDSLTFFEDRIPSKIKESVNETYKEKKKQIVQKSQIIANYFKKSETEYIVILKVIEKESVIFSLTLDIPSPEQAQMICDNWKKNSSKVFKDILDSLIKEY